MIKTSSQIADEVLFKIAGGGARTMKSFRRAAQRASTTEAEHLHSLHPMSPERRQNVEQDLLRKNLTQGLFHMPGGGGGVIGHSPKAHGGRFFTMGGLWSPPVSHTPRTPSVGPSREERNILTQNIPVENIRNLRGKFTLDPFAYHMPVGQTGSAVIFKGKIPSQSVRMMDPNEKVRQSVGGHFPTAYNRGYGSEVSHSNPLRYQDARAAAPMAERRMSEALAKANKPGANMWERDNPWASEYRRDAARAFMQSPPPPRGEYKDPGIFEV